MSWKRFIREYFIFSKKERIATFLVLGTILIIYLLPRFTANAGNTVALQADTAISTYIQNAPRMEQPSVADASPDEGYLIDYTPATEKGFTKGALFTFDPNTLPSEGWERLGLPAKTIKTINNYRNKGGRFYKREDLQKIWGLPSGFYERIANYIDIKENENFKNNRTENGYPKYEKRERIIAAVSINEADTAALIALPGIGPKLAQRIINFRDRLGGFASADQIGETYGLPDSTFQKLKPYLKVNAQEVRRYNINTATKEELKQHPYIRWNLANAIVEYRNQHGTYTSINDLKKIALVDENMFAKIAPYISL